MRIGFYAPMKPPAHPVPSGDRLLARLLIQALESLGHSVTVMSDLRIYDKIGNRASQLKQEEAAMAEREKILKGFADHPDVAPSLWFTYHSYYKAPDFLGPEIARALNIPYVLAEASYAHKRAAGPWADWHLRTVETIQAAQAIFSFTQLDQANLAKIVPPEKLCYLPPFLDLSLFSNTPSRLNAKAAVAARTGWQGGGPRLITVAMMRHRDKLPSYLRLSEALLQLQDIRWRLMIVGDGEARSEVEAAFMPFGNRVAYFGERKLTDLPGLYAAADLYVWPALGEAFGMAPLEAQAAGLPVVAGNIRGLPDVVQDGITGLLSEDTTTDFAAKLRLLLTDPLRRRSMGLTARRFIFRERSLKVAAKRLAPVLEGLGIT